MFLHTVVTGLQSDNIKRDLQPYLELPNVSDELLEKLNTSCTYESERQDKRRMLTLCSHPFCTDQWPPCRKERESNSSAPQGQWSMPGYGQRGTHNQYSHMFAPQPSSPAPTSRRRRRCFACQQNNTEDCMHCYGCGSNEHFLAGCRMRGARQYRGSPLNGQGSLQMDREWLIP